MIGAIDSNGIDCDLIDGINQWMMRRMIEYRSNGKE
jgi:hypothetical protein